MKKFLTLVIVIAYTLCIDLFFLPTGTVYAAEPIQSLKINSIDIQSEIYLGNTTTIAGYATGNDVLYKFWLLDVEAGKWQTVQNWSRVSYFSWRPQREGLYRFKVQVKEASSENIIDDSKYIRVLTPPPASIKSLNLNPSPYEGQTQIISGDAASVNQTLYRFWMLDYTQGRWQLLQDWSQNSKVTWRSGRAGLYRVQMQVKDPFSKNSVDNKISEYINVQKLPLASINSLSLNPNPYETQTQIISGDATSVNKTLYRFWMLDYSQGQWQLVQDWSENSKFTWRATKDGLYRVQMQVKDLYSKNAIDNNISRYINVQQLPPASIKSLDFEANQYVGQSKVFSGEASSINKVLYRFWILDYKKGQWQLMQNWSEKSSFSWRPETAGLYRVQMQVKDIYSENAVDSSLSKYLTVQQYKFTEYKYTLQQMVDTQYSLTANSTPVYWSNGTWLPASKAQIESYVDPNNYMDASGILDSTQKYQFLVLSYIDSITAVELNQLLAGKGILDSTGEIFLNAAKENNINPAYLVSHALLETGNGSSALATGVMRVKTDPVTGELIASKSFTDGTKVYNLFGIGATDDNRADELGAIEAYKRGWTSLEKAIYGGAQFIAGDYISKGQNTLYKMRWNPDAPATHQYATDIAWASKQVYRIKQYLDEIKIGLIFEIPQFLK